MNEKILEKLYEPFNLKSRPGQGGKTFKYATSNDIVDRMNRIFQGNWSTEVISSEIVGEQILMLVRVMAKDPTTGDGMVYYHEGYASHQLAKFGSGTKQGQVIDAGNSYRSAMSKAVKAAVAKWGVGLYLDGDESEQAEPLMPVEPQNTVIKTGATPTMSPHISPAEPSNTHSQAYTSASPPSGPPSGPPAVGAAPASELVAEPVHTPALPPSITPPVFEAEPMKSESAPAFVTEETIPDAGVSTGPPMAIESTNNMDENRTEVQKVAMQTIMSVHSLDFAALAVKAIDRGEDLPTDIDFVKYHDAVTIIQYGNNISQPPQ